MATYQAVYDYKNTSSGMLSFRCGDKFTVKKKTNEDWWEVEGDKGVTGLVPVSYLELLEDKSETDGGGGGGAGGVFTALYDFTGQDSTQLTFLRGEQLKLEAKTDVSWWTMKSLATGLSGYVPLNYIDVPVETATSPAHSTSGASTNTPEVATTIFGNHGNTRPHPHDDSEALSEVLLSVDRAMQKIHDEATLQGGTYTPQQRATLQQLATHRKSVVEENSSLQQQPQHTSTNHQQHSSPNSHPHKNTTPSPSLTRSGLAVNGGTANSLTHTSPRPRRKAPAPPSNHTPLQADHFSSLPRRSKGNIKGSRSREDLVCSGDDYTTSSQDVGGGRDRSQTQPQHAMAGMRRDRSGSQPSLVPIQNHTGTAGVGSGTVRPPGAGKVPSPLSSPQKMRPLQTFNPASPQRTHHHQGQQGRRRVSEQVGGHGVQRTLSSSSSSSSLTVLPSQEGPGKSTAGRSKSFDIHPRSAAAHMTPPTSAVAPTATLTVSAVSPTATHTVVVAPSSQLATTSPSHQPRRPAPVRTSSAGTPDEKKRKITLPPGLSPRSSPLTQRRHASTTALLDTATPMATPLPTQFPASDGSDLIEVVRTRTQLSYAKSVQAVKGMLEVLRDKLPDSCSATMNGLLSAVQASQANTSPSSARKVDNSSDMVRLKEIFFQLRDVREDSQQRGWAVHDDLGLIMEYLSELLQILCDADQEVTRAAVRDDKYENILTLIGYYDIESRIPIRLLMLQVFGVLCGLDREIISVLLNSILPNELGRDINNHLTEIEKTLYSSTVCTMIFSTGEAIPLTVYDQWNEEYISFLLDSIESPPEQDTDEQLPDAFLNVLLSFNQHFTDPETNPVMSVLKTKRDPRHFSEKFMFLINRGDDPVALTDPLCPDSLTKFALDIFSSQETSGMFYTTDLMVLIDVVLRQISDLCPGDKIRGHYLELLHRIVGSTDYRSHCHRQKEITAVLNRVSQEEGEESRGDKEIVKKIWAQHHGCFDEITDL